MSTQKNILLAGCGNLGRAMLKGWLRQDETTQFVLLETNPGLELLDLIQPFEHRIKFNPTSAFTIDAAVFAVKPQVMDEVLGQLGHSIPDNALVISVAAGRRISSIEKHFQENQPVVRVMPNVAAGVGEAASVCVANVHVSSDQRTLATTLAQAIGIVEWVTDETVLDPVTALSASGSAYVFLLVEEMAKAGVAVGLSEELAMKLARQTVIGAGALLKNSDTSAQDFRQSVTSPGGTTEAALKVLMGENGLGTLMTKAIQAATQRAKELAN
ncbi:MAG: pyrroline-5-carboxylate reductase [Pseudomonadota bacterium]